MNRRMLLAALANLAAAGTTKYFLPPIGGWTSPIIFNPSDPAGLLGNEPHPYKYYTVEYNYLNNCDPIHHLVASYFPTGIGWRRIDAVTGEETYHPYVQRATLLS